MIQHMWPELQQNSVVFRVEVYVSHDEVQEHHYNHANTRFSGNPMIPVY